MKQLNLLSWCTVLLCLTVSQIAFANENLGVSKEFNAFILEDFESSASDSHGRIAVGGNASLDSYGVASLLPSQPSSTSLLVAGNLSYAQGKIFVGSALVGGSIDNVNQTVIYGLENAATIEGSASLPIDFVDEFAQLKQLSNNLSKAETTGTVQYQWGGVYISGDCTSVTQVFNLEGATLLKSNHLVLSCVPSNATIVFNINGSHAGFKNIGLSQLHNQATKILYNFHQASSVEFTWIGVEGSVLAPYAHFENPRGQINGTVIAKSWNGPMELHHFPFEGSLQAVLGSANTTPIANNQTIDLDEDTQIEFELTATNQSGNSLLYEVVSQPENGRLFGIAPNLVYQPNENFSGVDTLTFRANSSNESSDTALITFNVNSVNDVAQVTSQSLSVLEEQELSITLAATDLDQDPLNFIIVDAPNFGSLQGNAPDLVYTPNINFSGQDSFTYKVNDGELDSNIAEISIQVIPVNDVPLATNQSLTISEEQALSISLSGIDLDQDPLNFTVVEAPNFGSLQGSAPDLVYTPNINFSGQDSFTYKVNDGELDSNIAEVSIQVTPVNDTPQAIGQSLTISEEQALSITLSGIDLDQDALIFTVVDAPSFGSLQGSAPDLIYTPNVDFSGQDSFTYIVNDGELDSSVAEIVIQVEAVNDAPQASSQSLSTREEQSLNIALLGTDPEQDTLSFTVVDSPSFGSLEGDVPNLVYTPNADFSGQDSFTYKVNDGELDSNIAVISIQITPVNDAPQASSQSLSTQEEQSLDIALLGTDPEQDALSFTIVDSPSFGSLGGDAPNLTYTPNADFSGQDSFTYQVNDGELDSSVAEIVIQIEAVNDAPKASSQSLSTQEEQSLNITLLGTDPEQDALSFTIVDSPSFGSLQGDVPNLDYTPNADFSGQDSFTYKVNDGQLDSDFAVISIQISPVNDAPQASSQSLSVDEGQTVAITLSGNDSEQDLLSFIIVDAPDFGSLEGDAPNLVYAPNAGFSGQDIFTYKVNDGQDDSAIANISITVINISSPPEITSEPISDLVLQPFVDASSPLNLNDWEARNYDFGAQVVAEWVVNSATGESVEQRQNARPSMFIGDLELKNAQIKGTFSVNTDNDDDYVGFVFGEQNTNEFYLFDWKKGTQDVASVGGLALAGMNVKRFSQPEDRSFWLTGLNDPSANPVNLYHNSIPWVSFVEYEFSLSFFPGEFTISIKEVETGTVLDTFTVKDDTYTSGRFGFYNYSQERVAYSGFRLETVSDREYQYQVLAQDPDGDKLTFQLLTAPDGMTIDETTGLIRWVATTDDLGEHPVSVEVTDNKDGADVQNFVLTVTNSVPVITSEPATQINAFQQYSYNAAAIDPDPSDVLTFSLLEAPAGMTVNPLTGSIQWLPLETDVGVHPVRVQVTDLIGGFDIQSYQITVTDSTNGAPVVNSSPIETATLGQEYLYQLAATDPEFHDLSYALLVSPQGMTIDTTGIIRFTPQSNGDFAVQAQVTDQFGATAVQSYTLTVVPEVNSPPQFLIDLEAQIYLGTSYSINLADFTEEPDGQAIRFEKVSGPDNVNITENGFFTFTPTIEQIGVNAGVISVSDTLGAQDTLNFTIDVLPIALNNSPPLITSVPTTSAQVDVRYGYGLQATDPDSDQLSFRLLSGPDGATLNQLSGALSWTPTSTQTGSHGVIVQVDDNRGGFATQAFTLLVGEGDVSNTTPVINSTPILNTRLGNDYQYLVQASDADNDVLTYALVEAPQDMQISNDGLLSWTPSDAGQYRIIISVSDGQSSTNQAWFVNVLDTDDTLSVQISISPEFPAQGEPITLDVVVINEVGTITTSVALDDAPITVDSSGVINTGTLDIGTHELEVSVSDISDTVTQTLNFSVRDPNDTDAPVVTINSLTDGQVLTAPADVIATVNDDNLESWQLVYLARDAGPSEFITLASGDTNFEDSDIAQFDPSLLRNGQYALVLIANDFNGNTSQASAVIEVDRDLKVGNFSITFEDLNIPLGGIPISVRRTYDSRDRAQNGDFGFGWNLDYQNVKIEESRSPGFGWQQNEYPIAGSLGVLFDVCTEPQGAPVVTVTLPDGNVERFEAGAMPRCNLLSAVNNVDIVFTAVGDTQTTLEARGGGSVYFRDGHLRSDILSDDIANPNQYLLTTRAGFVYELNQSFGVERVIDPNGNTLTYTDDGIIHSDGKSVEFVRDASGRITQVVDPMGRALNYDYDLNGDLNQVTERDEAKTTFTYNQSHGLVDIIDPLGRNIVRNIYDDNGRLIAQEDSEGLRTNFTHNLDGRESILTDRNGNTSFIYYDDNGYVTSQVDALGNITQYTHDANGNELTQENALGNTSTATYNSDNDQLTQIDALGNLTVFEYDQRGKETKITDARGNEFDNVYDSVGNLLSITDPLGNIAGNTINRHGLPDKTTDVLGQQTNYTYDDEGNKLTETDAENNVMSFTYDENNNVLSETTTRLVDGVAVNETTTYEYDERDRVIKTIDALGNETQTEYDLVGNEVAQVDALGRRTTMEYDTYNRLLKTIYPDGTSGTNVYDPEGNLLSDTDRLGRVTSYEYDALYRLIKTTQADDSVTSTEYDAIGRVVAEVDANGNRTTHAYDVADRRISTTDALGDVTRFEYDADGNMVGMTDANGNVTQYLYNELDQKVRTTFDDDSTMHEELDALSRRNSMTDQAGVTTNYTYDQLNRLVIVTDALGQETTFSYDSRGNKLTQTDAQGRTTRWGYDALNRVISRTLPLGQQETMEYDGIGNVTSSTNFNGQVTSYTYDINNRMTSVTYEGGLSESFTYDAIGNRTQSSKTENGTTNSWNYTYDELNRLESETKFVGTPQEVTLGYEYDAQGNRTMLTETTVNTVRVTRYTFDVLNRLNSVQDPDGNTTTYRYDAVGNRIGMTHENGIQTSYVYDELNRLTSMSHKDADDITLKQFDYTLLANGKRSKIEESNGRTTDYTYDELYRLTQESVFDLLNASHSAEYTYDRVGNRTFEVVNGVSTAYTVDANDRLTQTGGTVYTHDAQGNTLTETLDGNQTSYAYNAKQELTGSVKEGTTTSYLYNVDGMRIGQSNEVIQTLYVLDTNRAYAQVIQELVDGAPAVTYTYGDDLVSQQRAATTNTYHYDGLGSTRLLSGGTGVITDEYDYDAFGEILNQQGDTENNYLFTGEQFDTNLDQYYLRARYYDQGIGRFTQMDTWQGAMNDPITLHKYLYANADPVNIIDPSGYYGIADSAISNNITGINSVASVGRVSVPFVAANDAAITVTAGAITARRIGAFILAGLGATTLIELSSRRDNDEDNNQESVIIYRGTSALQADDIILTQRFDKERIYQDQINANAPPLGIFVSRQLATARSFAEVSFGNGRRLGPEVVKVVVQGKIFRRLESINAILERPIDRPLAPGQSEIIIPFALSDFVSGFSSFSTCGQCK